MADLIVTPWTPGLGGGQRMRTYGIVRALAANGPVDVLYPALGDPEPSKEYKALANAAFHPVKPSRGLARGLAYLGAVATGVPPSFARGVSAELLSAVEELSEAPGRRRVIADGPISAALCARVARRRPVIYNAHNLESAFRRQARAAGDPLSGWMLPRFERRILELASESWMVSPKDMESARTLAPAATLKLVPNVVDVAAITPVGPSPGARRALMVADFGWPPNLEGAGFVRDSVLPLVWERLPDARLVLVGRGLDADFAAGEPRIEMRGFVTDLAEAYGSADCAVVPLLTGGGSPLKFVEALAYGLPVVATAHAAAGLDVQAGDHYLGGSSAGEVADALVHVLSSGAPEMAARGRALAQAKYSIEALTRILAPEPAMEVAT